MTPEEIKQEQKRYEERLKVTFENPDKLLKVCAGVYMFYHSGDQAHYNVCDDSVETGGQPCWVVREERTHNVANDYPRLKDMKRDWGLK